MEESKYSNKIIREKQEARQDMTLMEYLSGLLYLSSFMAKMQTIPITINLYIFQDLGIN
jgi:hypothetical protein